MNPFYPEYVPEQTSQYIDYNSYAQPEQEILDRQFQLPQSFERRIRQLERENERQTREINQLRQENERQNRRLNRLNQRLRAVEARLAIPFYATDDGF
ncbi:hypothetical protein GMB86_14550 [Terrilactibacillus sp. BCM23-1]|uniref:Uncharacterized protein n=1 Tax=Terrilactibacillus tamarindi TaxID=2599694 RepID=A0A6N8CWS8_9BACI|nr:hypothetical protein [Terrilactibacillus tamarindi]MTT33216.1 hypothetical protein [Terrilactibacillus tamarindi]